MLSEGLRGLVEISRPNDFPGRFERNTRLLGYAVRQVMGATGDHVKSNVAAGSRRARGSVSHRLQSLDERVKSFQTRARWPCVVPLSFHDPPMR